MAEYIDELGSEKKRRIRKPTWTDRETRALVTEFDRQRDILRPKTENTGTIRADQRHSSWVEICKAVNIANPLVYRTISEVQKKWQNLCLTTKKDLDMKGIKEIQTSSRNEVENIVIRDLISSSAPRDSNRSPGADNVDMDYVVKIENLEEDDEDSGDATYNEEYHERPETTIASDQEITQSDNSNFVTSGSHDTHVDSRGIKRTYSEAMAESDSMRNGLFYLKKRKLLLEIKKFDTECEKLQLEKEKLLIEKDKIQMERDKLAIEIQMLKADHSRSSSRRDTSSVETPKRVVTCKIPNDQIVANQSVKEKELLERERIQLENEKLKLELQILRNSHQSSSKGNVL